MAELDLSRRIVYHTEGMRSAHVQRDIVYRRDGGTDLLMDVYAPAGLSGAARLPAVLFVHGGPIPAQMKPPREWGFFISYGELAASAALIGITFNHRLHALTDYRRSQDELAAAIAYVREHADELNVDPERLGVWIFSGGGPLLSGLLRERPPYLRCALAFYAVLDLRPHMPANTAPADVDATRRAAIEQLSPAALMRANGSGLPIFVARAGLDMPQINQSIESFVIESLAGNAMLELMNHPTGRHGFDLYDDDARSREIIGRALAFAQTHVRS